MIPEQILEDLSREYPAPLPRKALKEAGLQRDDLIPIFLSRIDECIEHGSNASKETINSSLFIFHLLGEWQERTAYRPLIDFLNLPSDTIDLFFGDTLTTTAWRVIYSVFDGDFEPIASLIHNTSADEFARWEMFRVLTAIALNHPKQRESVISILEGFYEKFGTEGYREDSCVWSGWGIAICELQATELYDSIKHIYNLTHLCEHYGSWARYEKDLLRSSDGQASKALARDLQEYENPAIKSTADELSSWYAFSETELKNGLNEKLLGALRKRDEIFSEVGKVGRNDPCPCGSGKKFKKCCLH
jgi:hypothetical protein